VAVEDELTEDECQYLEHLLLSSRGHLVAAFFAAGLLALGIVWWKIVAIYLLVYFLHGSQFGTRRLEQASLLLLALGILSWIDVISAPSMIENAKLLTATALR
jgi:hypothetical protein